MVVVTAHVVGIRIEVESDMGVVGARIAEGAGLADVILQDPGEGVANMPWICPRANGVHDQLNCWTVTIPDESNQVVHKCPEMVQLILGSFGRGLAASIGSFVEDTFTGVG